MLQAVVLGIVQGLTEFLPISSSAHLILLPRLVNWPDQGLLFDVAANSGTLVAVVFFFRQDLLNLLRDARNGNRNLLFWLVAASVPLGMAGLTLAGFVEGQLRSPMVIAAATLGFGLLLGFADFRAARSRADARDRLEQLTWRDAAVLGALQALALIPGTSRSGITMTGGLLLGMDRELAARTSFLMAIPAGCMVALKGFMDLGAGTVETAQLGGVLAVFLVSAVSGWLVISLLLRWLRSRSMMVFVVYRIALAALLLAVFSGR